MSNWTTEAEAADNFLRGIRVGTQTFADVAYRSVQGQIYGDATGFVYFIGVGEPTDHVKIGFTSSNPYARMKSLQTGCPQKLRMIGFVFGNQDYERELHSVLKESRAEGEWFAFDEYVQSIIRSQLEAEYL